MANKPNYPAQMDQVFAALGDERPPLLLHACCGPCSSSVLEVLCAHFQVTVLYYNPNIWPPEEYRRRADELASFLQRAHALDVKLVEEPYDPQEFYTAVQGLEQEPEKGSRCTVCYRLRMERAAQYAKAHGFVWFTTTLSVSPLKDPIRINQIGEELAARYGLGLSGGSDYHGMAKPGVELGRGKGGLRVTVALLDALKARRKRPVDDAPEVL